MVIPKFEPPVCKALDESEAASWLKQAYENLIDDQGAENGLAISLPIIELKDPRFVHGFLTAYQVIREALEKKQIKELEDLFRCPNP